MYTIKQASARTGVSVASLRAWERRYGIVAPRRTDSGYRLYDEEAIATLSTMRRLVDEGWSPAAAAESLTTGEVVPGAGDAAPGGARASSPAGAAVDSTDSARLPEGEALTETFLAAAASVDVVGLEAAIDRAFALGTFELVTDHWVMPTLRALGDAWAAGRVDVAGEHAASHALMRRLSQSFAAAASYTQGPRVVIGLPSGSHHELGALAFATAARRRGVAVVYLGADLPSGSWVRAVRAFPTRAAVVVVPTAADRSQAARTVEHLRRAAPGVVIAVGGGHGAGLAPEVVELPVSIGEAAQVVETVGLASATPA